MTPTTHRYLTGLGLLGFVIVGAWLVSAGGLLALPMFALTAAVWVVLVVAVVLRWLTVAVLVPLARRSGPLVAVAWASIENEPDGAILHRRAERTSNMLRPLGPVVAWLSGRLRPNFAGLGRTAAVTVALAGGAGLVELGRRISSLDSTVIGIDERLADLALRTGTPLERAAMVGLTEAGRTVVMAAVTTIVVIGFWAAGHRMSALIVAAITLVAAGGVTLLKAAMGRARPGFGSLVETSHSWPSGHASAGLALALAIVVAWWMAGRANWEAMAALVIPIGLMIGYSRAYLAIHWSSDVVGGWLVATTAATLMLALAAPTRTAEPVGHPLVLTIAMVLAAVIFAGATAIGSRHVLPVPVDLPPVALPGSDPASALGTIDPFSETLTGRPMEPIGIVFAGSRAQLVSALTSRGWSVADPPTLRHVAETYWAGIRGRDNPTAPVTPTFFDGRVHDLAVEKPVEGAPPSVSERHHARFWRLPVQLANGCPVWVATASLDDRVVWTPRTVLPNHHIDPAIDLEQAYLASDLEQAGMRTTGTTVITEPSLGTNAAGDPWFTDGYATVLASPSGC